MNGLTIDLMNFGITPIPLLPEVCPNGKLVVPKIRCSPRVSRAKCQICPTEFMRKGGKYIARTVETRLTRQNGEPRHYAKRQKEGLYGDT